VLLNNALHDRQPQARAAGLAGHVGLESPAQDVLGESRAIVMIRDELTRFGIGREAVYAKGYWNLNSRPTR